MSRCSLKIIAAIQIVVGIGCFAISFGVKPFPLMRYLVVTGIFLFILLCLIGFKWWKLLEKRQLALSIVNTLLVGMAAFLIGGLGLIWQHGLFVNNPPKINNFLAHPNPVEPGKTTTLEIRVDDDEDDPLIFEYEAEKGTVPKDRVQDETITYTAPNETGWFKVTVTVFDTVERPSYPSYSITISVAWKASEIQEYNKKGFTDLNNAEYEAAITSFDKAIADAKLTDAYMGRGLARAYLGKWDDAILDFTEYIRMQPDTPVAYLLRAYAYQRLGWEEESFADVEAFRRRAPHLIALTSGFEAATYMERFLILDNAIKKSPNPFLYVLREETFPISPPPL